MKDKVYAILSAMLEVPQDSLHEALRAEELPNWDSIRHLNLVLALEQEFGLVFTEDDILGMLSVQGILERIARKSQERT